MNVKEVMFQAEANAARLERTIVRLWILLILMLFMLIGTNYAWFYYESQFEDVNTTVTQDVQQESESGSNTFVGGDYHGETESKTDGDN